MTFYWSCGPAVERVVSWEKQVSGKGGSSGREGIVSSGGEPGKTLWRRERLPRCYRMGRVLGVVLGGRWKWQPTPVFLPGESQGRGSLVGCHPWGHTESDTTEVT